VDPCTTEISSSAIAIGRTNKARANLKEISVMSLPGFTAEASLYRATRFYQMTESDNYNKIGIYPAQFLATPYSKVPIDFFQTFGEPQCIKICLGGYCRWICF
jgi:hypothetical protein